MKDKDLKKIVKIILIAGIILCGIAQIFPWGRLELDISEDVLPIFSGLNINYYHWGGMQIDPKLPGVPEWFLTPTNFSGISGSPEIYGFAFGTLFLYFIIPLALISLITGVVAYRKIERKFSKNSLHAAFSSVLAVIFFIIFMQLTLINNLSNIEETEGLTANYNWLSGFYLMIISAILCFISYCLIQRIYKSEKVKKTETSKYKPNEKIELKKEEK